MTLESDSVNVDKVNTACCRMAAGASYGTANIVLKGPGAADQVSKRAELGA